VVTPESPDAVADALAAHDYLVDIGLATAIYLAITLPRPLLLEGEAGVGKTEVARVLSRWTGGELVRLQCYEGIDAGQALYEWDYSRQLLHLRAVEASGGSLSAAEDELYSERFLARRPLLRAVTAPADGPPPVLLIDEIDRADDEFEALLLEVLSEYAVTVPEVGTFRAAVPPLVVVTSNRTRDVHDALKRRCLYHWVEHPDFDREVAIVALRAPAAVAQLTRQVAAAVETMRTLDLYKPPGVAETIDWAQALAVLGRTALDADVVDVTLGSVVKYREDQQRVRASGLEQLVASAKERAG
jgi:MoxR-like ATPase